MRLGVHDLHDEHADVIMVVLLRIVICPLGNGLRERLRMLLAVCYNNVC
jgi:hypothetical protein